MRQSCGKGCVLVLWTDTASVMGELHSAWGDGLGHKGQEGLGPSRVGRSVCICVPWQEGHAGAELEKVAVLGGRVWQETLHSGPRDAGEEAVGTALVGDDGLTSGPSGLCVVYRSWGQVWEKGRSVECRGDPVVTVGSQVKPGEASRGRWSRVCVKAWLARLQVVT